MAVTSRCWSAANTTGPGFLFPKLQTARPNGCRVSAQLIKNITEGMAVSDSLSRGKDALNGPVVIPEGCDRDFSG